MKTKLTIFCWLALTLLLPAADLSAPIDPKLEAQIQKKSPAQLKTEELQKADARPNGYSAAAPNVDTSFPNVLANDNWQKAGDVTWGNVIILRRSTDGSDPAGKTILFRWRAPEEKLKNPYSSTRSDSNDLRARMRAKQFENRQ